MTGARSSPRTVTVGVDGSPGSLAALRWALALAEGSNATVQAVMAWRYSYLAIMPGVVGAVPPRAEMQQATVDGLAKVLASQQTGVKVEPVVAMGSGAQVLLDASVGQDLLVVGRRERSGLKGLGSTSRHVAIHAPTSVAVIPPDSPPVNVAPTIAVGIDGSDRSVDALVWAARNFPVDSELVAVHSHDESMLDYHDLPIGVRTNLRDKAERRLDNAVDRAITRLDSPIEVQRHVYEGDPRTTLLEGLWDIDAMVVGDRGHSGVAGLLLGSFASYVVGHAEIPVVVARRSATT